MPMTAAKHADTLFRFTDSDYVMDPDTRSVSDAVSLLAGCPGARESNPVSPSVYGGCQGNDLASTIHARSHTGPVYLMTSARRATTGEPCS